jgi:hypothetical protein
MTWVGRGGVPEGEGDWVSIGGVASARAAEEQPASWSALLGRSLSLLDLLGVR